VHVIGMQSYHVEDAVFPDLKPCLSKFIIQVNIAYKPYVKCVILLKYVFIVVAERFLYSVLILVLIFNYV
jgi:hypothetical protein